MKHDPNWTYTAVADERFQLTLRMLVKYGSDNLVRRFQFKYLATSQCATKGNDQLHMLAKVISYNTSACSYKLL